MDIENDIFANDIEHIHFLIQSHSINSHRILHTIN